MESNTQFEKDWQLIKRWIESEDEKLYFKLQTIHWSHSFIKFIQDKINRFGEVEGIWKYYFGFAIHSNYPENLWFANDLLPMTEDGLPYFIVPRENITPFLKGRYETLDIGLRGYKIFYKKIKEKYIGISERDIQNFLKSHEVHQRTLIPKKMVIIKPSMETQPNNRWQMDLLDMRKLRGDQIVDGETIKGTKNKGKGWMLTVTDVFTKYTWLEALKSKNDVKDGLQKIFLRSGFTPKVISCDNGTEFTNEIVHKFCEQNGIKIIHGLAYKPTSQGNVERRNRDIKMIIRRHFLLNNTDDWVSELDKVEENLNSSTHHITGFTPKKLQYEVLAYENEEDKQPILNQVANRIRQWGNNLMRNRGMVIDGEFKPGVKQKLEDLMKWGLVRIANVAMQERRVRDKNKKVKLYESTKRQSKSLLKPYWSEEIFIVKSKVEEENDDFKTVPIISSDGYIRIEGIFDPETGNYMEEEKMKEKFGDKIEESLEELMRRKFPLNQVQPVPPNTILAKTGKDYNKYHPPRQPRPPPPPPPPIQPRQTSTRKRNLPINLKDYQVEQPRKRQRKTQQEKEEEEPEIPLERRPRNRRPTSSSFQGSLPPRPNLPPIPPIPSIHSLANNIINRNNNNNNNNRQKEIEKERELLKQFQREAELERERQTLREFKKEAEKAQLEKSKSRKRGRPKKKK